MTVFLSFLLSFSLFCLFILSIFRFLFLFYSDSPLLSFVRLLCTDAAHTFTSSFNRDRIKALKLRPRQLLRLCSRNAAVDDAPTLLLRRSSIRAELCTVFYCGSSTATPHDVLISAFIPSPFNHAMFNNHFHIMHLLLLSFTVNTFNSTGPTKNQNLNNYKAFS